jgi:hypothetical protein
MFYTNMRSPATLRRKSATFGGLSTFVGYWSALSRDFVALLSAAS